MLGSVEHRILSKIDSNLSYLYFVLLRQSLTPYSKNETKWQEDPLLGLSRAQNGRPNGQIVVCDSDGFPLIEAIATILDGLGIELVHEHIYYTNMGKPAPRVA